MKLISERYLRNYDRYSLERRAKHTACVHTSTLNSLHRVISLKLVRKLMHTRPPISARGTRIITCPAGVEVSGVTAAEYDCRGQLCLQSHETGSGGGHGLLMWNCCQDERDKS